MSDNPFSSPSTPGGGFSPADHDGRLLFIEPLSYETSIKTSYGETDAVRADIAVIDGDDAPQEFPDSLIFPAILVSQTKNKIGEKVLGRLGTGTAKPGQSAPWILSEATEQDVEVGKRWLAHLEKRQQERAASGEAVMAAASEKLAEKKDAVSTPF